MGWILKKTHKLRNHPCTLVSPPEKSLSVLFVADKSTEYQEWLAGDEAEEATSSNSKPLSTEEALTG